MTNDVMTARSVLPKALRDRATVLAHEPTWTADDVRAVIAKFRDMEIAVVGVELWEARGDAPKWVASSDYRCAQSGTWQEYVNCCAAGALAFVERFASHPGGLFNLAWMCQDDTAH